MLAPTRVRPLTISEMPKAVILTTLKTASCRFQGLRKSKQGGNAVRANAPTNLLRAQ
jgi:hypothetical protein